MNKKIFYTVLGAIVVLVVVALLWWWFLGQPQPTPSDTGGFGSAQNASTTGIGGDQETNIGSETLSTKSISGKLVLGTGSTLARGGTTSYVTGTVALGPGSTIAKGTVTLGAGSTVANGTVTTNGVVTTVTSATPIVGTITLGSDSTIEESTTVAVESTTAASTPPITIGTVLESDTTLQDTTNIVTNTDVTWLNQDTGSLVSGIGSNTSIKSKTTVNTVFNPTDINSVDSSNPSGGVIPVIEIA
ncbi:MAG: hypothetical protein Q7S26_02860, partial [bacterium]|nr:hypothetical protein [bacterium]